MLSGLALLLLVCLNMRVQGKPRSQVGHSSVTSTAGTSRGLNPQQLLLGCKMSITLVNSDGAMDLCELRLVDSSQCLPLGLSVQLVDLVVEPASGNIDSVAVSATLSVWDYSSTTR